MGILEVEGFEALQRKAKRYIRDVVNELKSHITTEMERIMSELNRLSDAVDRELSDDAAQNELIAELRSQLAEATDAAAAAQAGEAGANERLNEALSAAGDAADRLESNDAQPEEPPTDEEPVDNGDPNA